MSANSPLQTQAIKDWLKDATVQLVGVGIGTAKLDAEIILAHTLRKNRTYLHAHDDEMLDARHREIADARLDLRLDHVPIAYIIGHKEFYGRRFQVTPAVLIPRPESEAIITSLKHLLPTIPLLPAQTLTRLVDVGSGSGCLGITAKLEFPEFEVTLLDISRHALKVAAENATRLGATVATIRSNLLAQYPFQADIILANLPYVNPGWERSPETNHEPALALFADDDGLELIRKLLSETTRALVPGGILILEADPVQHATITSEAKTYGLKLTYTDGYALSFTKS